MSEFDWMTGSLNRSNKQVVERIWQTDLQARAALLARLGFGAQTIEKRLRGNLTWEFDKVRVPIFMKRVNALVGDVCKSAVSSESPKKTKKKNR